MRISLARLAKCVALASAAIAFIPSTPLRAQEKDTNQRKIRLSRSLASISRSLDDVKWSSVSIYKVDDELKTRLLRPLQRGNVQDSINLMVALQPIIPEGWPGDAYNGVLRIARGPKARKLESFKDALATLFGLQPDELEDQDADNVRGISGQLITKLGSNPKDYYLITTRDKSNPGLIALIGVEDKDEGPVLKGQTYAGIDIYNYLQAADSTLYGDIKTAAATERTPGLLNRTFTLRNLSEITLAPRTKVRATYLDENNFSHVLLSISAGRPLRQQDSSKIELLTGGNPTLPQEGSATPNTVELPHEVSVGTDIVASYIAYKSTEQDTLPVPEPEWGVELRNNFDEINYPSIWGGRLTLNAILENIKIGAVLPQLRFGSTIDSSGFGSHHQKIIGGYGIAMSGDFAAPILDNSGLFNFYGSYTFSESNLDALHEAIYTPQRSGADTVFNRVAGGDIGYLIRYAFQGYYSFGFYADAAAKNLFRLKIGGTVYGVDFFSRGLGQVPDTTATLAENQTLQKFDSKSVGGVSGKVEFMRTGQTIPWGVGVQYFDQSLLGNVWLQFQFPFLGPRWDVKFEGKIFAPLEEAIDRAKSHPWENTTTVVPSFSLKYHF